MRRFLTFIAGDAPPGDSSDLDAGDDIDLDVDASPTKSPTSALSDDDTQRSPPAPASPVTTQSVTISSTPVVAEPASPPPCPGESQAARRLRDVTTVLGAYVDEPHGTVMQPPVIAALKDLAHTMVWADQHDPSVWDVFLECAVMPLLVTCLRASVAPPDEEESEEEVLSESEEAEADAGAAREEEEEDDDYDREFANVHVGNGHSMGQSLANQSRVNGTVQPTSPRSAVSMPGRRGSAVSFSSVVLEADSGSVDDAEGETGVGSAEQASAASDTAEIQAQILQTLSIVIQSVSRQQSLLCLFSSNHINDILSFEFAFDHDEMLAYFISSVKSIALKLDAGLLQLFFDPIKGSFPLYTAVTRFYDHPEAMVRIAMRNITLTIYALGDSEVLRFAAKDESAYFQKTVELLARLCGSVARAFELLLDDGREIRRTRSRTGIFRRRVKTSELTAKLEEVENICAYLGDVSTVSQAYLHPLVVNLVSSRLFSPFFRPIASQASPAALQLLQMRWRRLTRTDSETDTKPALPLFDAAARSLVLTCILNHCRSSPLGSILVRDLCRPTSEFEQRHVLHGLKGMATNITGTERVTFISLCAIEAFISCEAASKQLLGSLKYDFYLDDSEEIYGPEADGTPKRFINIGIPDEDDLQRRGSEPMLMTLSDFEAPLTPTSSRPTTPTLASVPSFDGLKSPPNGVHDSRMSSFDSSSGFNLSPPAELPPAVERSNSDGILSSFQFGETSLREAISSIVLVVRRREVRTLRVIHAIARITTAVFKRTSDINSCVDVTKIMLDELAGVIHGFMKNKRTTIVSIEQMFDNFRAAAQDKTIVPQEAMDLIIIVSPDRLPAIASDFPTGAGKRRRVHTVDATPPVEIEDAQTFCVMTHVYDESLRSAKVLGRFGSLSKQVLELLTENGVDDSYLDKREALEQVSQAVLKHGEIG